MEKKDEKKDEENPFKKLAEQLVKDKDKIKIEGNCLVLDSGLQKQIIGNIKEEVPQLKKIMTKFYDKVELAKEFLSIQPLYYDDKKIWWMWKKKDYRWIKIDETDILNSIRICTVENTIRANEKQEILEALKQVARENKPEEPKESWVQFKSQIIDIKTMTLIPATSKYFIFNPINWNLGKSEETPILDTLFDSWVDKEHRQELYELLAFCIVPNYFIHRLFCLMGSGSNGKSTFLNILEKFIGLDNLTSSSLNFLLKERFEGAKLYKKLICLIGETNFSLISNTDFLKKITGDDIIRCEFKGKEGFDFKNYAKIIMATNSIPTTTDKTDGFYRRWKIIDFYHKFNIEKDVLSEIPDEEFENLALKCLNLAKKLWENRIFTNDGDFNTRKIRFEERANPLIKFLNENYEKNIQTEVLFGEFFENLTIFLEERGLRVLSAIAVSKQLKDEGFEIRQINKNGRTAKYILGLKSRLNNTNNQNNLCLSCFHTYVDNVTVGYSGYSGFSQPQMPPIEPKSAEKEESNLILKKQGRIYSLNAHSDLDSDSDSESRSECLKKSLPNPKSTQDFEEYIDFDDEFLEE